MRTARILIICSVLIAAAGLVKPAAQLGPGEGASGHGERFSLGIIVGHPTGISAKLWLGPNSAVDGALAWSFPGERFHLHADYLHHFFDVFDVAPDRLPIYFGVGGNLRIRGDAPGDADALRSGLRVPVGVSFLSSELPLDAFAEIVPGMRLIPSTEFELWGGIGARYRF